ncbi:MAG: DUF86 domain-containing protein [bacterium]
MSKRSWKIVFQDMLEAITKIEQYTRDMSFDDFITNSMAVDAVVRNIEIIGEASRQLNDAFRKKYSQIPWNKIAGIRNRIVHEYFGVDVSIIWFIVENELQPLKQQIQQILSDSA